MPLSTFIPDWLLPTIALLPALAWMFFGVGLPWALVLLPRTDWKRRVTVILLAMALGPTLTTAAMFVIGTVARFSVPGILLATVGIAGLGLALALRRARRALPEYGAVDTTDTPLRALDYLLIAILFVAVSLRFWNTAYWPFTTYDALWVYGYNARLFQLHGAIPTSIGYYPQMLPLAYTYAQLLYGLSGLNFNDHAARTVLPYFAALGIGMTYLLGTRLFNRRIGLMAAVVWAVYPHHGVWSQFGDLEVTLTAFFTGTAAFFALGWRDRNPRYIVISGLLLSAALWTKPTAGALVQSLALIAVVSAVAHIQRGSMGQLLRTVLATRGVRYALIALIVAAPIGGMWYVRNVAYGHPPITLPAGYWQDEAQRSGQELGWPLLIATLGAAIIVVNAGTDRATRWVALAGLALLLAAILPSAFGGRLPTVDELRTMTVGGIAYSIRPTRLGLVEYALLAAGTALLIRAALSIWWALHDRRRGVILVLVAFVVPYFVTWFWSYSYHFRLSFPIVPLFAVGLAALLHTLAAALPARLTRAAAVRLAAASLIIVLALPGLWAVLSGLEPAATNALADDDAKIARGNPALMGLVGFLRERRAELGRPLRLIAPGESRLGFFFPEDDIRYDVYPMWLDEIMGADYFIENSAGRHVYTKTGRLYNQVLASLTRDPVMWRQYTVDDGNFRFSAYELNNTKRFTKPTPNGKLNAQVGDFAFLHGHDLSTLGLPPGETIYLTFWWEALKPADLDYSVFIHLFDPATGRLIASWGGEPVEGAFTPWQGVPGDTFTAAYHTRLWQTGEIIKDEWKIRVPEDAPPGRYELRVGLWEPISGRRLPITQEGSPIGDSIFLNTFEVLPR